MKGKELDLERSEHDARARIRSGGDDALYAGAGQAQVILAGQRDLDREDEALRRVGSMANS
jgi:hypothetical protein